MFKCIAVQMSQVKHATEDFLFVNTNKFRQTFIGLFISAQGTSARVKWLIITGVLENVDPTSIMKPI